MPGGGVSGTRVVVDTIVIVCVSVTVRRGNWVVSVDVEITALWISNAVSPHGACRLTGHDLCCSRSPRDVRGLRGQCPGLSNS